MSSGLGLVWGVFVPLCRRCFLLIFSGVYFFLVLWRWRFANPRIAVGGVVSDSDCFRGTLLLLRSNFGVCLQKNAVDTSCLFVGRRHKQATATNSNRQQPTAISRNNQQEQKYIQKQKKCKTPKRQTTPKPQNRPFCIR